MTDEERNHYNNLIYLCGTCHTRIDAIPQGEQDYPTGRLLQIKSDHEQKVLEATTEAFANVGFPELEVATEWILQERANASNVDFDLTRLEDKLKTNRLGDESRHIISMGLSVTREVGKYVESVTQTEPNFPERLKSGFLEEYFRLRRNGYSGDELFNLMCHFAQRGFSEITKQTAGLSVLIYLFERCDVFER